MNDDKEVKDFRDLKAWQKSMSLVSAIYKLTENFPKSELYGLTSQLRRAAVSVPTNIAEGVGRNYKRDTIQFLHISRGSLYELFTLLTISVNVKITESAGINETLILREECVKILNGLITYYETSQLK